MDIDEYQLPITVALAIGVVLSVGFAYSAYGQLDNFYTQDEVENTIESMQQPIIDEFDNVVQRIDSDIEEVNESSEEALESIESLEEEVNDLEEENSNLTEEVESLEEELNQTEQDMLELYSWASDATFLSVDGINHLENIVEIDVENKGFSDEENVIVHASFGKHFENTQVDVIKSGEIETVSLNRPENLTVEEVQVQ